MTARDRLILMVLAVVGLLAGFWFLALAPKREEAKSLSQQIATEQQRLDAARTTAATARQAKERYDSDYAVVAQLGKAVPTDDGVPSLISQLQAAAKGSKVDFVSVNVGGGDSAAAATSATTAQQVAALAQAQKGESGASAAAASPSTTLPAGASVGAAGFPTMSYDLRFDGTFFAMQGFLDRVQRMVQVNNGQVEVNGRLLTIDNFALAAGPNGFPQVTATINATGYLLPPDVSATGGATPAGPTASGGGTTTTATVTGVK